MKKSVSYSILTVLTLLGGSLSVNPPVLAQSSTQAVQKLDINTASDAQLLKLPGFGPRMLKEVKEYRPFKNMAHFRKEMGKYLSKAQLDKLETYIYVK